MPSLRRAVGLLCLLDLTSALLQLDFKKEKRNLPLNSLRRRAGSVQANLENAQSALLYLVNVTVGTPPQHFALQLDTGSSDIWIPYKDSDVCQSKDDLCSNGAYDPDSSSTFKDIGQDEFQISYVDGTEITGDYITETFGIGRATISKMTMGLAKDAKTSDDTSPFQGIVGVGFASGESLASDGGSAYPNIINQLKNQGHTSTLAYSLWLNDLEANTGSILFGGVDNSKYQGDLTILPIQPDSESGTLTSFTVVLDNLDVDSGSGKTQYSRNSLALPVILDSGTSLTYVPDDIATDLANGVGAQQDQEGNIYIPCDVANSPATINFGFGNSGGPKIQVQIGEFVVPYPPQPDGETPQLNDGTPICQWGILPAGDQPILFGDTFLRSAYVVYDLQNKNIGIAQTVFNASSSDVKDITGGSLPGASSTATGAVVTQTFSGYPGDPTNLGSGATGDVGGGSTATFDLSGTKSGAPGSTSHKGVAGSIVPPSSGFVGFMTAAIVLVSGLSGVMMVLL